MGTEQLIILDNHCLIAGTDTNFPATNQFGLYSYEAPHFQEVADTRWMIVCYYQPIFEEGAVPIATPPMMAAECSSRTSCPHGPPGYRKRRMLFGSMPSGDSGDKCFC